MPRLPFHSLVLAIALACAGCGEKPPPAPPPPDVLVVDAVARDVPVVSEWLGTTEGSVDAQIRAQVAGYLVSRDYQEGQRVEVGDLLFKIDPRVRARRARAGRGRSRARAVGARARRPRRRPLHAARQGRRGEPPGVRQRGRAPAERGGERPGGARARVDKAKIDLGFTEIRSPIAGIVGIAQAQLGDFVGPSDPKPLTSVSQLDPIRVSFPLSEQEYLLLRAALPAGARRPPLPRRRAPAGPRRRQRLPAPRHRATRPAARSTRAPGRSR